jgi:ribosomal protein S18 acetylase RimI-like enzyme
VLGFLDSDYYDDVLTAKPPIAGGLELIALAGDEVVGLIDVSVAGPAAAIESIAVHPDHGRRGIATALLERALADLAERGVERLEAWTREDAAANGWYRSCGFAESECYLHVYAMGREETARAVTTADPGLVAVQSFLHMVDMGREDEVRGRFGRVYVCRRYERAV